VNRELGTTTAVIIHNAIISEMADRVILLSGGSISGVRRNERKIRPRDGVVSLDGMDGMDYMDGVDGMDEWTVDPVHKVHIVHSVQRT